jgi:hypothetical protein
VYPDEVDDVENLELTFSASVVGKENKTVIFDLVEDGRNVAVDNENKIDFQRISAEWRLRDSVLPQLNRIIDGIFP